MDDGAREQYKNGLRRFKTRHVKDEAVLAKLDGRSVPLFKTTVDLFESYQDPDNYVSYSAQVIHLKYFFEPLQYVLN